MPTPVDVPTAARLFEQRAQFVEVLPASAYEEQHIPGAVSIPLPDLTAEAVADLDPDRPVVTYCFDFQCDLSSRAAVRFELLGFGEVYDFVASKAGWMAACLPVEGSSDREAHAGDVARTDVATCGPDATLADVADAIGDGPVCVVVDDRRVVVGAVRADALRLDPSTPVEAVLQPGPPTVRPSIPTGELLGSMGKDGQDHVLVTTYDGVLVGLVEREALGGA